MTGDPPPRRRRGPAPGAPDGPRRVGDSLNALAGRLGAPKADALGALFSRWEEIAGPALATHARPLRLSGGVLVVAVDHPAWATQVRALGASLLAKVAEVTGELPERLEISVRKR